MDKIISQMTKEEKLQVLADYHACKRERHIILRYIQALRREDAEQTAYFESFGESVHQIVLNVNTYERRLVFGYVDKQFNEYGWINGMLPIVEEIRLDIQRDTHRPVREWHVCRYGELVYRNGRRRQPPIGMGRTYFRLQGSGTHGNTSAGGTLHLCGTPLPDRQGKLQPEVYPQVESRIAGTEVTLYRPAAVEPFLIIHL